MDEVNGYKGTIVSGTGSTYTMNVTGVGNVTATTVHPLASGEQVPANSGWLVVKISGVYYFNPPTWID